MSADKLKVGSFYWVIPTHDPDTDDAWTNEKQPARYEGEGCWTYLGQETAESYCWPAIWVGPEIVAS